MPPRDLVAAVRRLVAVVEHAVPPLQAFAQAACGAVLPADAGRTLREALPAARAALEAAAADAAALPATPDVEAELRRLLGPEPLAGARALVAAVEAAKVPAELWAAEDARVRGAAAAPAREARAARVAMEWVRAFELPAVKDVVPCANRVYARLEELERLWRRLCRELGVDAEKARTNTLLALSRRAGHAATMALKDDVQVAHRLATLLGLPAGGAAPVAQDVVRVLDELQARVAAARGQELLAARLRAATGEQAPARVAEKVAARLEALRRERAERRGAA